MDPIPLTLPAAAILAYNALYPVKRRVDLQQDVLLINLPDGTVLDVGWYPQWDPDGAFVVTTYGPDAGDDVEHKRTTDPHEVARFVEELAERVCKKS